MADLIIRKTRFVALQMLYLLLPDRRTWLMLLYFVIDAGKFYMLARFPDQAALA